MCIHHWDIEEKQPTKATSTGVCRKCGESFEFPNYFEMLDWVKTENAAFLEHKEWGFAVDAKISA